VTSSSRRRVAPRSKEIRNVRELQSTDSIYRLLVENITDYAIYMIDPDGFICSWNPGAEKFKGYTADEIIGHHFSEFFTPEDRQASLPQYALTQAFEYGKFESEGWRLRKDGSKFWAYAVLDSIRAPDGTLLGYAKITRDISQQREARESLLQMQKNGSDWSLDRRHRARLQQSANGYLCKP